MVNAVVMMKMYLCPTYVICTYVSLKRAEEEEVSFGAKLKRCDSDTHTLLNCDKGYTPPIYRFIAFIYLFIPCVCLTQKYGPTTKLFRELVPLLQFHPENEAHFGNFSIA